VTQWHPIFAYLLRQALQDYYDMQTNVPVGDVPREADIIVLRRASDRKPPFRTLWKHLSRWNILEFKGRSESARVADIDLLVEVGLGIHRRLQEKEPDAKVPRGEVSFWYLTNHLGKRFLRDVIELTGELEAVGPGLWRGGMLGRPLWLVSNVSLVLDEETAPARVVSGQSDRDTLELAKEIMANDEIWQRYRAWLLLLYPHLRKEFRLMATKRKKGDIDLGANLRLLIHEMGPQELMESGLARQLLTDLGVDEFLADLTPQQRVELLIRLQANTGKKKHATTP
jgi:hypothetical protein